MNESNKTNTFELKWHGLLHPLNKFNSTVIPILNRDDPKMTKMTNMQVRVQWIVKT